MKLLNIILILTVCTLSQAQYIEGDFVKDISFTDSDLNDAEEIVYSMQSIKSLIESGKVVVISFFNPG